MLDKPQVSPSNFSKIENIYNHWSTTCIIFQNYGHYCIWSINQIKKLCHNPSIYPGSGINPAIFAAARIMAADQNRRAHGFLLCHLWMGQDTIPPTNMTTLTRVGVWKITKTSKNYGKDWQVFRVGILDRIFLMHVRILRDDDNHWDNHNYQ